MSGYVGTVSERRSSDAEGTQSAVHTEARPRITGIDLARALAIIGMLAVHVGSTKFDTGGWLDALPWGRASILFGLLAGVGVTMLATSRSGTLRYARQRLAWRAMILLPLGLLLQEFGHGLNVILQHYAVLFVLGIVTVTLPNRWLLTIAAAFGLLGPLGFLTGQIVAPTVYTRAAASLGDPMGEIAHKLILSGPYPLITWAAPFLLGMWLGRLNLRAFAVRRGLILCGGIVALLAVLLSEGLQAVLGAPSGPVGWSYVITNAPHSQTPLWLIGATGAAAFVLGVALILGDILGRWAWPLVATGQLSLTVYVGHLLTLRWWLGPVPPANAGQAALVVLKMTACAAAFSMAWLAVRPRGPLEAVLSIGPRRRDTQRPTRRRSIF